MRTDSVSAISVRRAWSGESTQAGSVRAASPGSANAWPQQPPQPICARPKDRHGPVFHRPAIILHMGDFDALRAELYAKRDHRFKVSKILSVHDEIGGERKSPSTHHCSNAYLLFVPVKTGDAIGARAICILETQLYVFESGTNELRESRFVEEDARRDEIGVKTA